MCQRNSQANNSNPEFNISNTVSTVSDISILVFSRPISHRLYWQKRLPSDEEKVGFECVPGGRDGFQKDDGITSLCTWGLFTLGGWWHACCQPAAVAVEDKTGYEKQEINKFLPLKNTAIKRQIASSSMFTLGKRTVSLMRCRKPDRQLGNHSLFTAALEGRDDMGGGCWESGGVGVKLEAPAWANSSWEGVVLIPVTDMLLSLEQTW